jgi:hypothetical protein
MGEYLDCVGEVKEDQATDDRVKGLRVLECPYVGFNERDVVYAGRNPALLSDLQQPRAPVDTHDRAARTDQIPHVKRDVT